MQALESNSADYSRSERIVLVDDDPLIREVVGDYLCGAGYDVEVVADGRALLDALSRDPADLVLLDIMMPGMDGLSICRKLADEGGPCVVLHSAITDATERIVGLELGADDYVSKPASPRELVARIKAVLRRRSKLQHEPIGAISCDFAGWSLNLVSHELHSPEGVAVSLSHREFSMLRRFLASPRRILQREQLLGQTGDIEDDETNRGIDVQVCRLRRKLAPVGDELIRTVRNRGYIFTVDVSRNQPDVGDRSSDIKPL